MKAILAVAAIALILIASASIYEGHLAMQSVAHSVVVAQKAAA
jgi:hypothetical protein